MKALFIVAFLLGLASAGLGAVAAFTSAQANMSFNEPLSRAGCAFLLAGAALLALSIWGLRS
jgi:hypothetical protein